MRPVVAVHPLQRPSREAVSLLAGRGRHTRAACDTRSRHRILPAPRACAWIPSSASRVPAHERLTHEGAVPLDTPYEHLRQRILSGELPSGTALIETTLADQFGLSRTPIREALRRLEQDGLVERDGRQLRVRAASPSQILDIFEVRIPVEAAAARSAAERHTDIDRARLQGHLRRIEEQFADDPDDIAAIAELGGTFHRAVWQAAHNDTMIDVLERLDLHMRRMPVSTFVHPGRAEKAHEEHVALAEAIFARDRDQAAQIAHDHTSEARRIRLMLWENDPDTLLA